MNRPRTESINLANIRRILQWLNTFEMRYKSTTVNNLKAKKTNPF